MQDDTNEQTNNDAPDSTQPIGAQPRTGGQIVIQPSTELINDIHEQQQQEEQQLQAAQPPPADSTITETPPPLTQQAMSPQAGVTANNQAQLKEPPPQPDFSQASGTSIWEKYSKPLIVSLVLIVVLGAGLYAHNSLTGYGTKKYDGDGFTYDITYSKNASKLTLNGKTYLQGKDETGNAMLLYIGKSVESTYDCHTITDGTISVIDTPTIEGQQHNLCYSRTLNAYVMNFTQNNVWYFMTILPKDKDAKLDQDTIKMIASSVESS